MVLPTGPPDSLLQADLGVLQAVEASPPPSAESKGKRKAVDELVLSDTDDVPVPADDGEKPEESPVEELDPEEVIELVTIPAANIVGLKYYRGVATRASQLRRGQLRTHS